MRTDVEKKLGIIKKIVDQIKVLEDELAVELGIEQDEEETEEEDEQVNIMRRPSSARNGMADAIRALLARGKKAGEIVEKLHDKFPLITPQSVYVIVSKDKKSGGYAGPKERACKACGKPGHNSKTCPDVGSKEEEEDDQDDIVEKCQDINAHQYDDIKEAQTHGMNSKEVAEEMNLSITTINAVFSVFTYQAYRKMLSQ